jgi:purine-cytosine permease-like protein
MVLVQILGAAVATAMINNKGYQDAYDSGNIGGLLAHVLIPPMGRFGEFCVVVLALSIIANNTPNSYSIPFSLQVLAKWTQRIPRFVWTLLGACAYVAIAVAGYDRFSTWLENFLVLFSYWLATYQGIALSEHFIFRRGVRGYRPEDHTKPAALPPGFAAITSVGFGIMGGVLGMSQPWFVGPIGRLCGSPERGGDVGLELAFAFSSLSYVVLRKLEKGYFGR